MPKIVVAEHAIALAFGALGPQFVTLDFSQLAIPATLARLAMGGNLPLRPPIVGGGLGRCHCVSVRSGSVGGPSVGLSTLERLSSTRIHYYAKVVLCRMSAKGETEESKEVERTRVQDTAGRRLGA